LFRFLIYWWFFFSFRFCCVSFRFVSFLLYLVSFLSCLVSFLLVSFRFVSCFAITLYLGVWNLGGGATGKFNSCGAIVITVPVELVLEVVAWVDIVKWRVTVLVVCVIEVVDSELAFCGIMVSWSCSISFLNEYQFQLIFIFKITEVLKSQSN
jgi:hypothetical protein